MIINKIKCIVFLMVAGIIGLTNGCAHKVQIILSRELYTAYNLWYVKPDKMWFLNFKEGTLIPAGTKVEDIEIKKGYCRFTTSKNGETFGINFCYRWHPGLISYDYKHKLFTEKPFDELTAGMTKTELDSIERGEVVEGMKKRAVLVSYGYPPEHNTPDLESDKWAYWINKYYKKIICFGENDTVVACDN